MSCEMLYWSLCQCYWCDRKNAVADNGNDYMDDDDGDDTCDDLCGKTSTTVIATTAT